VANKLNMRAARANAESPVIGIWGNVGLALLKGGAGWLTGSQSLLADGFRSGGEAFRWYASRTTARSGGRRLHPGHSQAASALTPTVLAAMLLLVVGVELGLASVRDLADGAADKPDGYAAAAVLALWLVRVVLFADRRAAETLCTAVVLTGTGAAWMSGRLEAPILAHADECAAIAVGILMARQGYRQLAGSLAGSRSAGLCRSDVSDLSEAVQRVNGVIAVETLHAREQGHYVAVELTISVNPRITVAEGQEIARRVKDRLLDTFTHVTDVQVHVDSYDPGYPYKSNHDPNQDRMPTLLQ